MSSMVVLLLIIVGCVVGAPIDRESMEFELIDCRVGQNGTSSYHILQIKDLNETCLQINKTTSLEHQLIFYTFQETEINDQIEIATDDCSSPTPDFHIIPCEKDNSTDSFVTSFSSNFSLFDFDSSNSTIESFLITEDVLAETIDNSDEYGDDHRSTDASSISDQSSEDEKI